MILPTLHFQHQFSTGLCVTLAVERAEDQCPRLVCDKRDFHDGIESEYVNWVAELCCMMVDERLLTSGEITALAIRSVSGRAFAPSPRSK